MGAQLDRQAPEKLDGAKKTYLWWIAILGGLLSAPSVISVIQREFAFGLAPALARFVEFYRDCVLSFGVALNLRSWPLINALTDLQYSQLLDVAPALFVTSSIVLRAIAISGERTNAQPLVLFLTYVGMIPFSAISPTLAILLFPLVLAALTLPGSSFGSRRTGLAILATSAATIAAVVAFYFGNLIAGE